MMHGMRVGLIRLAAKIVGKRVDERVGAFLYRLCRGSSDVSLHGIGARMLFPNSGHNLEEQDAYIDAFVQFIDEHI
jgi:hypothetical protein